MAKMARISLLLLFLAVGSCLAKKCNREPPREVTAALKTAGDNGYKIILGGETDSYTPGTVYTITLMGPRRHSRLLQFRRFMMTVEALGAPTAPHRRKLDPWSPQRAGRFQLFGDALTAFNERCINTVKESEALLDKTEVQVMWTAPPAGSGCVVFRAMVFEDENNWYMDDGGLSLTACEPQTLENGVKSDECCACSEAKYQVMFEGLWSAETHPKDFPTNLWLTHFSDVIGASHTPSFLVWGEGHKATDGLRQLAEWGSPRTMEAELRTKRQHIRTIVKAAGLWHPHVNANTSSTFRVDKKHPEISLVSMLGPSPDWIVGVSGLNLCLPNCTWLESHNVDLLPYDAGTDGGITYMSPNDPTEPRQPVRKITRNWPADETAPFYNPDPEAPPIEPLARLYFKRQNVVPRDCDYVVNPDDDDALDAVEAATAENDEDTDRPECRVGDWDEWTPCSVTCGKGLRMRSRKYLMPQKAEMMGCGRQLVAKEMCAAEEATCPGFDEICAVSEWGLWSECSVMCGHGFSMRNRHFLNRMGRKKCTDVSLVEKKDCVGVKGAVCYTEVSNDLEQGCHVTMWSHWSPCTVSCGTGRRGRSRFFLGPGHIPPKHCQLEEWAPCHQQECQINRSDAKEICSLDQEPGLCRGYFQRFFFNSTNGQCEEFIYGGCRGNANNFDSPEKCEEICGPVKEAIMGGSIPKQLTEEELASVDYVSPLTPVDCMITPWAEWSECSASCGVGHRERTRMIKLEAQNGGKPCPKKLSKRKKCNLPACN
ncbi:spondin-1-like [Neocloeon triangulifer]|uniref:spondin-1-like n=1 Tax=Neocloeon triangulifer TaxID=2078957 RepID=UPI00286F29ED|nr:spondin-1-like [Neocloeon triangulifer]